MFLSTTAVFLTEIVKLITCFLIVIKEEGGVFRLANSFYDKILKFITFIKGIRFPNAVM